MKRNLITAAAVVAALALPAHAANIVDEWASVKAPPPPALKPVTVDSKTTALLMLDFMKQNCGVRPRCMATLPAVKKLLGEARAAKATVIYTKFGKTTFDDIVDKDLAPAAGEASVTSFADKFLNTDLDKILKDKGIQTVIAIGTAANGAVLLTGTGAALRGVNVIVPVDGISSVDAYSEQFSVWQLANGPTFSQKVTITKMDMIKF
ncbi:MAG: isochorismatase family protein [Hyphomicrobiales bacterium]|jgi:nicotinamidase-related amidase